MAGGIAEDKVEEDGVLMAESFSRGSGVGVKP